MLMIFGGEQYYAAGGANDFICMAEESKAQLIAYKLIGKTIKYIEEWDPEGEFAIEQTIEWTHVSTQEGIILHTFGRPYGICSGKRFIQYLEETKNVKIQSCT